MNDTNRKSFVISIFSGIALLSALLFMAGVAVAHYRVFPYEQIREAVRIVKSLARHGEVVGEGRKFVAPEGAARSLATVHDPEAAIGAGHYALLGWESGLSSYAIRLFDAAGTLVHTWPIDEMSFSSKPKHRQNSPHAMEILKDGSVLVSFDWIGLMARLDPCGDAVWVRDGYFHHSFAPSADGAIWTWYGEQTAYGQIQDILKFDPETGQDVGRVSLNRDVIKRSPESALNFSMHMDFPFVPDGQKPLNIFHPNDVEELLPEMAVAFPQFEAGDLLLSIRELDMLAVISPSGELKWNHQGPWLKQHDPDFEPSGRISVYDNSRYRPRSFIMTIDPETRVVTNALPDLAVPFNSEFRGKHQLLPNGNRLITIPEQGQAIEVTPGGRVVVEFNNVAGADARFNEDLVNAKWLYEGYFEAFPVCEG